MKVTAAVVTVSDGVASGVRRDESGDTATAMLRDAGFDVTHRSVVPDERAEIETMLRDLVAAEIPLVVTTGGTGFGPRDVTPEATRAVIDREAPGLAELMRRAGLEKTPNAALSRAVAGSVASTLVINLPGSVAAVRESLEAVLPLVPHAVALLEGETGRHPTGHSRGPSTAQPETREDEDVVIATAVRTHGSPPCAVGQRLVVGPRGPLEGTLGCAEFDSAALADAPEILAGGAPDTRTYTHELGSVEVFLEPRRARPRLVVLSATPVALELLRLAGPLGYSAVLVEPRTERVTPEHRALAAHVVGTVAESLLDDRTVALATDHDAPYLSEALTTLLHAPVRFLGVMGSARHVGPHLDELRRHGFSDQDLARIRTPVGLDIGARTPAEIALSMTAGVVAAANARDGGWLDRRD